MAGGLRVRLTFTFTASGLSAPPYVAVSGLTEDELSPELCVDGILAEKIPGLCKGGDDLFNEGFGWLVFLRADRKNGKTVDDEAVLSIANKKFEHYNNEVLLPFIRSIREKLGWKRGQPVEGCLKCVSWSDGDIGQLQTLVYEAREALDEAENIIRNKHASASTGRQQPCDLSPVFRLLKLFQRDTTAKDDVACGLAETIDEYFANILRAGGLNLDGNPRKKKALIETIGRPKGYFEDLSLYCGMAFDPSGDVKSLCSNGESDSLFIWNKEAMTQLRAKGGDLQKLQLDAVVYLWELCYDLLLAERVNVSVSPGFESLGLRVNRATKRKATEDAMDD